MFVLTSSVTRLPFCTFLSLSPPASFLSWEQIFHWHSKISAYRDMQTFWDKHQHTHIHRKAEKIYRQENTLQCHTAKTVNHSFKADTQTHSKVKVRGCGVISGPLVHCQWPINKTAHGSYGYYCIAGSPLAIARSGYGLLMIHLGWVCTDWSSALYWWQTIESI